MNPSPQTTDRKIRVFISSTFRDMQAERDILIKKIFPQLRRLCEERAITWTEVDLRWGVTNEEAAEGKVLPLCLEEIQRCRPYFIGLLGERYGSLPREIPAELLERQKWLEQHRDKSITELEIIHGVFGDEEMHGHAYFYFRDPKYLERVPKEKQSGFTSESTECAEKLKRLKQEIRRARDEQVCQLRENFSDPEELGEWILNDFTKLIEKLYPKDQTPDPLDQEAARHEAYARSRRLAFVGREELLGRLNEHCTAPSKQLVLTGESGCGKSALLAEWIARWRESHPDDLIIQHYIGSTPDSADWQMLVSRILEELKRALGMTDDLPTKPESLRTALNVWTSRSAGERRVVLVLDALNQLAEEGAAKDLDWLPFGFPTNFSVFVSSLPGQSLDALRQRGWPELSVPLFGQGDIAPAAFAYFKIFSKTPPKDIIARLKSTPAACNALFLRVVLDELRQLGKHDELEAKTLDYLSASGPKELYDRILSRWEQDFGKDLVQKSLSLIWTARSGLSETELAFALGQDQQPLPRALWTPFYLAAESSLVSRTGLLGFAHAHLRECVAQRYLRDPRDRRAVALFLALLFSRHPNRFRRLEELPWQLDKAEAWDALFRLLKEEEFGFSLWVVAPRDIFRYWADIERNSSLRMIDAYRDILENPDEHKHGFFVEILFVNSPYLRELVPLQEAKVLRERQHDDAGALESALANLAVTYRKLGEWNQAEALARESLEICRTIGNPRSVFLALGILAPMLTETGKNNEALRLFGEMEEMYRSMSDRGEAHLYGSVAHAWGVALVNRANALEVAGDDEAALETYREAERHARQNGEMHGLSAILSNYALILRDRGDDTAALDLLVESEKIDRELNNQEGLQTVLGNRANILLAQGVVDGALELAQEKEQICQTIGHTPGLVAAYGIQAEAWIQKGNLSSGVSFLNKKLHISRNLRHQEGFLEAVTQLLRLARERGDFNEALTIMKSAEEDCIEMDFFDGMTGAVREQAVLFEEMGNYAASMEALTRLQTIYERRLQ